jgi:hypothetical protein
MSAIADGAGCQATSSYTQPKNPGRTLNSIHAMFKINVVGTQ